MSPSAAIAPELTTKDFFYTCDSHLTDPHFATIADEEYLEAQRKKDAINLEIKALKAKWDEQNRYWTPWKRDSKPKEEKEKQKDSDDKEMADMTAKEADFDTILKRQPRWYELNADIYKIRLQRQKPKEKVDTTGVKDTSLFPSVPQTKPT